MLSRFSVHSSSLFARQKIDARKRDATQVEKQGYEIKHHRSRSKMTPIFLLISEINAVARLIRPYLKSLSQLQNSTHGG